MMKADYAKRARKSLADLPPSRTQGFFHDDVYHIVNVIPRPK
jgi:hypothetical protein